MGKHVIFHADNTITPTKTTTDPKIPNSIDLTFNVQRLTRGQSQALAATRLTNG
jgi:hypothetical protein